MDNISKNYFLPYQLDWINDESPLKLYEKSRRIGITYGTSYRCVRKCLRQPKNTKFIQWVVSRDEGTAREFITDYVAMWCKAANVVAAGISGECEETIVIDEEKIRIKYVVFANGARINSLSSNPKALAGKGGDILLDEFDLSSQQEILYDMAFPCTTWGGQLEIVSAYDPEGTENTLFATLVKEAKGDNPRDVSLHSTTLAQAIDQGFVEKVNEVKMRKGQKPETREAFYNRIKKSCRTIDAFNSQYDCIPNSASGQQAIRSQDLTSAKKDYQILRIHVKGDGAIGDIIDPSCEFLTKEDFWRDAFEKADKFAVGYDVARHNDLAAIWIDAVKRTQYRQVCMLTFKGCKFESQKQIMIAIFKALSNAVGAGDETGMGGPNCEALQTRWPERFKPLNFSSFKTELGTLLMEVFEQNRQDIPMKPAEIGGDIAAIRKDTSQNNKRIFSERPNEFNPDSHCDMGWSCAMAKYAGEKIDNFGPCLMEPCSADNIRDSFMRRPHHDEDYDKPYMRGY